MASDEAALSRKFREGSEDALSEAIRQHGPALYRICRRFAKTHEDADELLQETFVKAWEKRKKFKGQASLKTWLTRIAINLSLNFVRKQKSRPLITAADVSEKPALSSPSSSPGLNLDREDIQKAFEKLPKKQKAVVALRVGEDLPYEEIAAILECSISAAKSNFHFAVRAMREALK